MPAYIEEKDLISGAIYNCKTYDGEKVQLRYVGDTQWPFRSAQGEVYDWGDVRFAFDLVKVYRVMRTHREGFAQSEAKAINRVSSGRVASGDAEKHHFSRGKNGVLELWRTHQWGSDYPTFKDAEDAIKNVSQDSNITYRDGAVHFRDAKLTIEVVIPTLFGGEQTQ